MSLLRRIVRLLTWRLHRTPPVTLTIREYDDGTRDYERSDR